jgi:hypothetical protein
MGKKENQLAENSGPFPLASNLGTGGFDWDILSVPILSQGKYAGLCGDGYCYSLSDSFGGS